MTNSHNSTSTESCFSGILRRLLCTGSLPTHPSDSDHPPEFNKTDYLPKKNEHEVKLGGGTPGLVARLMGLDSLPADMTWLPNKDNSIHFRSRSLNSVDYLSVPFDRAAQESYHRRLRTSVSFREIPTTFLVCFDKKGDGDQGLKIKVADQVKRSTSGNKYSNTKKEKVVVVKKKENRETNKRNVDHVYHKRNSLRVVQNINVLAHNKSNDVYVKSSMKMKRSAKPVNLSKEEKVSVGIIKRSKQRVLNPSRAKKVEEPEHSSVDSTPDSIGIISGNLGKKNSTPKVVDKHFGYPCVNSVRKSINDAVHDQEEVRRAIHSTTKSEKLRRMREIEFYINKLVEVCRLTDEDTKVSNNNNWPWISSRSDHVIIEFDDDYQDICFDFGQEILEMLVQQVVDQLCEQTV